jgi:hypothetical protein
MTHWISDRLPTADDADLNGQVRWGPNLPGYLMHWTGVRPQEPWTHSTAWRKPIESVSDSDTMPVSGS